MPPGPKIIVYGKQEISGIIARPDSRQVMEKAADGYAVEVSSGNDYINLYHVFERLAASNRRRYAGLKLIRRQIGPSKWLLFVGRDESEIPDAVLDDGYDPKRGRYKRYADLLAAGDTLVLPDRVEAIKARRAWQLYVPRNDRRHLASTVRSIGKRGQYAVTILPRITK